MSTTTVSKIERIINYIKEDEGDNAEFALRNLDIQEGDDDSSGVIVHTSACNAEGYYDPLRDYTLIIPDSWDGVLGCSNNGWEWLGIDKCEINADIIRNMVTLDKSLDESEVDTIVAEVCDEIGIDHE